MTQAARHEGAEPDHRQRLSLRTDGKRVGFRNSGDTILNVRAQIIVAKSEDPILISRSYFYGSGRLSRIEISNVSPEFPRLLFLDFLVTLLSRRGLFLCNFYN